MLIIVNCFAWFLDIEEGKGIGGESIYGPFFEGSLLKRKAVFVLIVYSEPWDSEPCVQ